MPKLFANAGSAALLLMCAMMPSINSHALDLSEMPLFLATGAEPNVMFVLDDSLSMHYEMISDNLVIQSVGLVFPRANNVYSSSTSQLANNVPRPDKGTSTTINIYDRIVRSSVNSLYYNPAIRYRPWVKHDGTEYPQAKTSCALHNPMKPTALYNANLCRNLEVAEDGASYANGGNINWTRCTGSSFASPDCSSGTLTGTASATVTARTYYPATYWYFSGNPNVESQVWNANNYTKQEIRSANPAPTYTNHGRGNGNRTDCDHNANGSFSRCTYDQEIKNFANWYTYHRSRLLTSHAGIGRAFMAQTDAMRVGFGIINKAPTTVDGQTNTPVVVSGVRKFTPAVKEEFLDKLYNYEVHTAATPLRFALNEVGKYFQRTDSRGPWGNTPGTTDDITPQLACRRSNTILMTDGGWNDDTVDPKYTGNIGNADNTNGALITNHGGTEPANYQYIANASPPFRDGFSNTLADVAMHYWKTDLRTDLPNRVKPGDINPAFWQHMTLYGVGLGVSGSVTNTDVAAIIKNNTAIGWPTPHTGSNWASPAKIDDLLHASVNGRGGFFSTRNPEVFAAELGKVLEDIMGNETNNAAAAAANSTSLSQNSVIYQAVFNSNDWTGEILATQLKADGSLAETPLWSSSVPPAASRNIYTYNNDPNIRAGRVFAWNNLSATQKAQLLKTGEQAADGQARVDWIKGVDNTVVNDSRDLRNRNGKLLGDIVNSDPAYAGNNNSRFDRLSSELGGNAYTAYYNEKKKSRRGVIYVGANDGMLHAFNAGSTGTLGQELFAYVPAMVYGKLMALSSESYGGVENPHKYTVDGPIHIGDAYVNGAWRNILVGTLGAGARGIYVLDVTNPDSFGAGNVLFELTAEQYPELGNIVSQAVIAPGKDRRWKIYLGNGYNSSHNGAQKAFLGVIDIEDEINKSATSRTRFIATNNVSDNGLSQPALLPDADGMVRAAYAGDLQGNLWKFDLSGASSGQWALAYSAPLFVAQIGTGPRQPITSSPTLGVNPLVNPSAIMVYFGTGRYLTLDDRTTGSGTQSFYAIVDKNAAITTGRSTLHLKTMSTNAKKRTIIGETVSEDGVLVNAVDWTTVNGWYLDFTLGERVITKALLLYDRLIFPTVIPNTDACGSGGTGWLMELIGVGSGSIDLDYSVLGESAGNQLDVAVFGQAISVEGTGILPEGDSSSSAASSSSAPSDPEDQGCGVITVVTIQADGTQKSQTGWRPCDLFGRQSWRELR